MTPPDFWTRPPGWQARALSPLAALYARETARRVARQPNSQNPVPIVCVGNVNAGGTGKTPTVIAVASMLSEAGYQPHVLSRGYGGSLKGPVQVDPMHHKSNDVGDEPLLMSAFAPVWIARERASAIPQIANADADVIVMDDGLQTSTIRPDFSLIVVDAAIGFGNGRVIPAGPLREPVSAAMKRVDGLVSIGSPQDQDRFLKDWGAEITCPIYRGELRPLATGISFEDMRLFAFAGIGRPEKFFTTLRDLGVDLAGQRALGDHQALSNALLTRLARESAALGAQLVTTEKDATRLPDEWRSRILTVPVRLEFEEGTDLGSRLRNLLTL